MATELLSAGYVIRITQNTVYALPSFPVRMFCETTSSTIQLSNLVAFTTSTTVSLTTGISDVLPGGFVRCASGDVNIKLVKMA